MSARTRRTAVAAGLLAASTAAVPAGLSRTERRIAESVDRDLPATIALLQRAVDIPSATENVTGVRKVGDLFGDELRALGFEVRWAAMPDGMGRAGHLIAERRGKRGRRVLVIGHLDTVLEGRGFRHDGDRAWGNGTEDMKGGDVVVIAALRALASAKALDGAQIVVIFTGDEESPGKPLDVARRDLVELGRRSDVALAFEGAVRNTATIARRGFTGWRLTVSSPTAHSSGMFTPGVSPGAVFEAARILDAFRQQLGGEQYLTFNPSLIVGGTTAAQDPDSFRGSAEGKTNVIAGQTVVDGDLRFLSVEQRESAKQRMQAIVSASLPGTHAEIAFTDSYPAMSPTDGNRAVLKVLDQASQDLGQGPVPALDPGERGAGDVSFVATDVSGLDGLGAMGDGAHTPDEWADLSKLPLLVKRTAVMLYRLTR